MKRGAVDHFKMRRLARALQVPLYAANGLVMRLLHFTADHAPRGDVGRFNDQDIADACCWDREPAELVGGFTESGWLDRHPQCRLAVHDWYEHAEDSVHARVWRDRGWFMTGEQPRLRKLEEKERAKATAFYAEHQAPNAAEAAAAGSRESLDGCHSAPNGASPLPPPLPLPEGKRETAPDGGLTPPRAKSPAKTFAPDRLSDADRVSLRAWAERRARWALSQLEELEAACLDHFRGEGKPKADWLSTLRGWIRRQPSFAGRGPSAPIPARPRPPGPPQFSPEDQARADEVSRKREENRLRLLHDRDAERGPGPLVNVLRDVVENSRARP
jgi:hypothetical protein